MLKTWNKYKAPYLFILPFFLLFLVFQLIPSLWTIAISLTNWKGIGTPEFCGMDNYKKLVIDNMFWEALRNTVVYWITGLVFILALSVLIASLLNSDMGVFQDSYIPAEHLCSHCHGVDFSNAF